MGIGRRITNEELAELPEGSIVIDRTLDIIIREDGRWCRFQEGMAGEPADWDPEDYQPLYLIRDEDGSNLYSNGSSFNLHGEEDEKLSAIYMDGTLLCYRWEVPQEVWSRLLALVN